MHITDDNVASLSLDVTALSVDGSTEPPSEFRIFSAGIVDTLKGQFLFDARAAEDVLAAYADHGADLPIDYEHAQVDPFAPPSERKAAGWFRPEVRDGELWALDVRWTPTAAQAIRDREWRYISPAFLHEDGAPPRRVRRLVNVALTNLPATKQLRPLVASMVDATGAPQQPKESKMDSLLAVLGVKTETEALASVQRLNDHARQLCELTGKPTLGEALAVCAAWKDGAARVSEVEAQLSAQRKAAEDAEAERLIALAVDEKRLAPGRKDVAEKLYQEHGKPALEAFLSALSPLVAVQPVTPPEAPVAQPEALSEEDKRIARALGLSEAQALANKKLSLTHGGAA